MTPILATPFAIFFAVTFCVILLCIGMKQPSSSTASYVEEPDDANNHTNDGNDTKFSIPAVRMRSSPKPSCNEIHQQLVTSLFPPSTISFSQQNRRWTPQLCATRWNLRKKQDSVFAILDAVGWNITNGRKIKPDKRLGITGQDRCASYDTGVFVPMSEVQNVVNQKIQNTSSQRNNNNSTLPLPIYSLPSTTRLPKMESAQLLGANFASFVAAGIHKIGEEHKNKKRPTTENVDAPPWIVWIGDSRMRQLLARFMSMIRSHFATSSSAEDPQEHDLFANAEMQREGVIEHYFHANATYTVFGYKTKNEQTNAWDFFPTSDRFYLLPGGSGCDADYVAQQQQQQSCSSSSSSSSSSSEHKIQILFRICLWWHDRTMPLISGGSDFLSKQLKGGVSAAAWIPTLHELHAAKHQFQSVSVARLREVVPAILEVMENVTSLKNFVAISAPRPHWAPAGSEVDKRNSAVVSGMRDWYEKRHPFISSSNLSSSSSSATTSENSLAIFPRFETEDEVSLKSVKGKPKKKIPSSSLQVWFMDMAAWWESVTPRLCDQVHSMCNLIPMRPKSVEGVKKFCDGCKDPTGFVAVRELMRLLLA